MKYNALTRRLPYGATTICSIIITGMLLWPAQSHAAGVSRADLQYAVFSVLMEIRAVQQHMIDNRLYHLLPTVQSLLAHTMEVSALVQALPADVTPASSAESESADTAISTSECLQAGKVVRVGYANEKITVEGTVITALNGEFVCTNSGWSAHVCDPQSSIRCTPVPSTGTMCTVGPTEISIPDGLLIQSPGISSFLGVGTTDLVECRSGELIAR